MSQTYVIDTTEELFEIEVPDNAWVEVDTYQGTRVVKVYVNIEGADDMFGPKNCLAFYDNVEAVRCKNVVTRTETSA